MSFLSTREDAFNRDDMFGPSFITLSNYAYRHFLATQDRVPSFPLAIHPVSLARWMRSSASPIARSIGNDMSGSYWSSFVEQCWHLHCANKISSFSNPVTS